MRDWNDILLRGTLQVQSGLSELSSPYELDVLYDVVENPVQQESSEACIS